MIETSCLSCGIPIEIDAIREGEGYFLGYDTNYYGDSFMDERDPHQVIGHYCKICGETLKAMVEATRQCKGG